MHIGDRNSTVLHYDLNSKISKNSLIISTSYLKFSVSKSFLAYICSCYQLTGNGVLPLGRGRLQSTLLFCIPDYCDAIPFGIMKIFQGKILAKM